MPIFTSATATLADIDGAGTSVLDAPENGSLPQNGISGFADVTTTDNTSGILIESGAHLTITNQIVVTDRIAVDNNQDNGARSLTLVNSIIIVTGDRNVSLGTGGFPAGFDTNAGQSSFRGIFTATNSSIFATAQPTGAAQYLLFQGPTQGIRYNLNGFTVGAVNPRNFVGGADSLIPGFDFTLFAADVANSNFIGFNTTDGAINNGTPRGYRSAKQRFSRYGFSHNNSGPTGTDPRGLLSVFLMFAATSAGSGKHYLVQPDFSRTTGTSSIGGSTFVSGIRAQGQNPGQILLLDAPIFPSNSLPFKRDTPHTNDVRVLITNPYQANHVDSVGTTVTDVITRFPTRPHYLEANKALATQTAPTLATANADVTNVNLSSGLYIVPSDLTISNSTTMDLPSPVGAIPFRRWSFTNTFVWSGNNIGTYQVTGADGTAVTFPGTPLSDTPADYDNDVFQTTTTISGAVDTGVGSLTAATANAANVNNEDLDAAYGAIKKDWYDNRIAEDFIFSLNGGELIVGQGLAGQTVEVTASDTSYTTGTTKTIRASLTEGMESGALITTWCIHTGNRVNLGVPMGTPAIRVIGSGTLGVNHPQAIRGSFIDNTTVVDFLATTGTIFNAVGTVFGPDVTFRSDNPSNVTLSIDGTTVLSAGQRTALANMGISIMQDPVDNTVVIPTSFTEGGTTTNIGGRYAIRRFNSAGADQGEIRSGTNFSGGDTVQITLDGNVFNSGDTAEVFIKYRSTTTSVRQEFASSLAYNASTNVEHDITIPAQISSVLTRTGAANPANISIGTPTVQTIGGTQQIQTIIDSLNNTPISSTQPGSYGVAISISNTPAYFDAWYANAATTRTPIITHLADAGIQWDNTRVFFQSGDTITNPDGTFRVVHEFTGWTEAGAGTFSDNRSGAAEVVARGITGQAAPADINAVLDVNDTLRQIAEDAAAARRDAIL